MNYTTNNFSLSELYSILFIQNLPNSILAFMQITKKIKEEQKFSAIKYIYIMSLSLSAVDKNHYSKKEHNIVAVLFEDLQYKQIFQTE